MKKTTLSFIILFLTSIHLMGQWTSINSGTTENLVYITFPDSLNGYIIGADWTIGTRILLKTSDGGHSWSEILNNYYIETIDFLNEDTGMIFCGDTVLTTFNAGINWTPTSINHPSGMWSDAWTPNPLHMITANGWLFMTSWHVYITIDGGNSFQHTQTTCLMPRDIQIINDSTIIACGEYGPTVYKSMDRGYNWITLSSGNLNTKCPNASISFPSETIGYGTSETNGFGIGIVKSTDGGVNWNYVFSDTTTDFRCIRHIDENTLYAVGDSGTIVKTNNGGGSWSNDTSGSTMQLNEIVFLNNKAIIVGDSGTILMNTNISAVTSIKENIRSSQDVYAFPNPFKSFTTIKF